ncbi:hypothetical protein CAAN1_03S02278 [[Candida] anglica]|uniref:Uncharacterized protein n=1 Tax=[Candida] anglica TaxID=148631 RepID=A0ABP0EGR4_9ASCO
MSEEKKVATQPEEPAGIPSAAEQHSLMEMARSILNPNGENPRIDEYITSTFSYISASLYKVATATDKDAAAKAIADDLSEKFDRWMESRKEQQKIEEIKEDESAK